jgi:hypothetical protein
VLEGGSSRHRRTAGTQAIVEGANEEFADAGVEVDGEMNCSGVAEGDIESLAVDCTGRSTDGQELGLQGELVISGEEIVASRAFTGMADGEEVFSVDCIGETCDLSG